jgi:serine protease Do
MRTWLSILLFAMALPAQGRGRQTPLSYAPAVKQAFHSVIATANRSTAQVLAGDKVVALAAVVQQDGILCSKASEVLRQPGAALSCKLGDRQLPATVVGQDEASDLVLLRVDAADLLPITWADAVPAAGAYLASPDGSEVPAGIGIESARVYQYSRPKGFLGVRVEQNPVPAKLLSVQPGTAAAAADLQAGDVIAEFEDDTVASSGQFLRLVSTYKPGERVRIVVQRGEQRLEKSVVLRSDRRGPVSSQENLWGPLSEVRAGFGDVLEHDTILRPEQCGGPLVDLTGKVVGINIARAGRVETLALPAAVVQAAVASMLAAAGKH